MKTPAFSYLMPLLGLPLMGVAPNSLAAAFDCAKSHSNVEKMICADSSVSKQDSMLNRLYLWNLESATRVEKSQLISDQKEWMTGTRDVCTSVECLSRAYDARINAMSTIRYDGGTATYVFDNSDIARISGEIQQNLRQVGVAQATVTCSPVLSLDSHPESHGAFCSLGGRKRVEVCYENLAGNLAVNFYGFSLTGSDLASFTKFVCPGG